MSTIYLGNNVTAMLNDSGELTLRHNTRRDVTDTIVLPLYMWNYLVKWIEQIRSEENADAHRLLGPYDIL